MRNINNLVTRVCAGENPIDIIDEASRVVRGSFFRFPWGDPKADKIVAKLTQMGHKPIASSKAPGRGHVTDVVFNLYSLDAQKIPGIFAYRFSKDWEGFGPGSLESIEYRILPKNQVEYKGSYLVYTPHGETTVLVKGKLRLKDLRSETIEDEITDDIEWYLSEHPEAYS